MGEVLLSPSRALRYIFTSYVITSSLYIMVISEVTHLSSSETKLAVTDYWVESLGLYQSDKELIDRGRWLTDGIISASLKLLKKDHPEIGGLQPPLLGQTLTFDIQRGRFVQVCHTSVSYKSHCSSQPCLLISQDFAYRGQSLAYSFKHWLPARPHCCL